MPTPFEKLKQAVRTATPVVLRTAGDLYARVSGTQSTAPQEPASSARPPAPSDVAKNIPHRRPVATQPAPAPTLRPDDVPGGRLPPPR